MNRFTVSGRSAKVGAIAAATVLLALLIWLLSGGGEPDVEPELATPGPPETSAKADPGAPPLAPFIGVVVSPAEVKVSSPIAGRVAAVYVQVGDKVKQGARLAAMDLREARQELRRSRAALQAARAEKTKAQLEVEQASERLERLRASKPYTSEEEVSAARYREALGRAQVASAAAKMAEQAAVVERLRSVVEEGVMQAPFTGSVAQRFVDPGTRVETGQPIVRVIGEGVRIRFAVPEAAIASLTPGARVLVSRLEGTGERSAVVETVWPEVDIASRRTFVEARVEEDATLAAGTPVQVRLPR